MEEHAEDVWLVTANRYVAFFDIMGFKDLVFRMGHQDIYKMMKGVVDKIKFNTSMDWLGEESKGEGANSYIRATTYSDSIIVYSRDDSLESLFAFVCSVAGLTNDLFVDAVPHKGAIAYGTVTMDTDNSIFFGQPLIDAYLLQEELCFYGIVTHATIEHEIIEKSKQRPMLFIEEYSCHFKSCNATNMTVVPIYLVPSDPEDADEAKERDRVLESIAKLRLKTSGHLRKYIDNTESYFNEIRKRHRPKEDNA